jgi:hypothetical protein
MPFRTSPRGGPALAKAPAFEPSLLRIERIVCGCSPRALAISATVAPRGDGAQERLREVLISTGVGYK